MYEQIKKHWNHEGVRKYSKGVTWALSGRLANTVIGFLASIYVVRSLGPSHYGQLSYAISFAGIFSAIATLGIDTILYRELIKHKERQASLMGSAFGLKLIAGSAAWLCAIAGALANNIDPITQLLIVIISSGFVFQAFNVIIYEFQSHSKLKPIAIITGANTLILNSLKILIIANGFGVIWLAVLSLLEWILYAMFYLVARARYFDSISSWKFDKTTAKLLLKDSWPFIFIAALTTLYSRIDQIMIGHYLDIKSVGIYDAAVRIAEVWIFIPLTLVSVLYPAIVNSHITDHHQYKRRLIKFYSLLSGICIAIALPLSIIATPLMTTVYGSAFAESGPILSVYAWAGLWSTLGIALQYTLATEGAQKIAFYTSLGAAVFNIGLNMILIPRMGSLGAAWATLVSYIIIATPVLRTIRYPRNENYNTSPLA